jgi:hypothetical protein
VLRKDERAGPRAPSPGQRQPSVRGRTASAECGDRRRQRCCFPARAMLSLDHMEPAARPAAIGAGRRLLRRCAQRGLDGRQQSIGIRLGERQRRADLERVRMKADGRDQHATLAQVVHHGSVRGIGQLGPKRGAASVRWTSSPRSASRGARPIEAERPLALKKTGAWAIGANCRSPQDADPAGRRARKSTCRRIAPGCANSSRWQRCRTGPRK